MSLHSRLGEMGDRVSHGNAPRGTGKLELLPPDFAQIRLFGSFNEADIESVQRLLPECSVSLMTGCVIVQRGTAAISPDVLALATNRLLQMADSVVIHTADARFSTLNKPAADPAS